MSGESPEVQMARLQEQMKTILTRLDEAKEGSKDHRQWMVDMSNTLTDMGQRLRGVEDNFARASPTIDEFIIIKHKVIGAGLMGRWLWAGLGAVLTFLFTIREALFSWISK